MTHRFNNALDVTKAQLRLLNASMDIAEYSPAGEDMCFTHSILCQVGFPRSKTVEKEFMRRSGDAWINIQAGLLDLGAGPVEQTIPYGPLPRLALAWISTYAKRNKTPEIDLGSSASEFLKRLGMDLQGSRFSALRVQMHALASCRIQLGYKGRTFNSQPVEQFETWLSKHDNQSALWPGRMTLSQSFFHELMDNAVPLDYRALQALKGSSLALDVYCWLAHRLHRIQGKPIVIRWHSLRNQFAQEYGTGSTKSFKTKFLIALNSALAVYPNAMVKQNSEGGGGLFLYPSPPPIPYKH